MDDCGQVLKFKTVAYTNPIRKVLSRFEKRLDTAAEGYSVPVRQVDVYSQVILEGRAVFVPDTSVVSAQVVPPQNQGFDQAPAQIPGQSRVSLLH